MIEALLEVSPTRRERLAAHLDTGLLAVPYSLESVIGALGGGEGAADVLAALEELERLGVSGRGTSAWLRSLDVASRRRPSVDVVWSGPELQGVYARDTRRVYEELLSSARRSVWVSTYVFYEGPKAFEVLARRLDAVPDLQAILLLNIRRKSADTSEAEAIVWRFAERFWKHDWPGKRHPRVYYDPRAVEPDGPEGLLHAKAVVVDDEALLVTSANLTEAALDRNIELGLLVRDPNLATTVCVQFQALIDQGLLVALPSS
jgi:phosphatidylserine/phosphatidylglycerophosphate/cardiolipin synthase-like enzyme